MARTPRWNPLRGKPEAATGGDEDMGNGANDLKPKMLIAIEHLDAASSHMNSAMQVLSGIIFDLQKGTDFINKYRDSLIKSVETSGGSVNIEDEIRDFLPKRLREQEQNERQPDDA
jgi:hypothetical protein